MPIGWEARACAIGPNAGASMTSSSNLAIQRSMKVSPAFVSYCRDTNSPTYRYRKE
jgi:hypothetical protein